MGKLLSCKEISEKFGMKIEVVRNLCHARSQRFAYRLSEPKGKFYIDPIKFEAYLERKRAI